MDGSRMLLSHEHKFIFVHVQKTGGTSVMKALRPYCDARALADIERAGLSAHATAKEIIAAFGRPLWDEYFTFAFERNPWDKCVSLYYYYQEHRDRYSKPLRRREPSFTQWMFPFGIWPKKLKPSFDRYEVEGKVGVKFLGAFESLAEDFAIVCRRIGLEGVALPFYNRSQLRPEGGYRAHYSARARRRVERVFRREIELGNYTF
jgi:hypothetical protein